MTEERRQHLRVEWISSGSIVPGGGKLERPCTVYNLSNGGAKLSGIMAETLPDAFALRLSPRGGAVKKCRIIWRTKHEVGIEFLEPFPTGKMLGINKKETV